MVPVPEYYFCVEISNLRLFTLQAKSHLSWFLKEHSSNVYVPMLPVFQLSTLQLAHRRQLRRVLFPFATSLAASKRVFSSKVSRRKQGSSKDVDMYSNRASKAMSRSFAHGRWTKSVTACLDIHRTTLALLWPRMQS
jgi:hypothetical protein